MESLPISPPGKKSGVMTNESVDMARRPAGTCRIAPSSMASMISLRQACLKHLIDQALTHQSATAMRQ
jgi:hypothetical protein